MQLVRLFQPGDEEAFRALNEAWITKCFRLEDKDRETLEDPHTHILLPGGQIFMAIRDGERIGCCGLIALKDGSMEVAKMAVAESERGQGIGRLQAPSRRANPTFFVCARQRLHGNESGLVRTLMGTCLPA